MADAAYDFAQSWFRRDKGRPKDRWKVIWGNPGTGKTHTSRQLRKFGRGVAFEAWQKHWSGICGNELPTIVYRPWGTLADQKITKSDEFESWLYEEAAEASMVILDDIGTEKDEFKSGVPVQRLCRTLDVLEDRFLWITTNIEPRAWKERWDARVEDRLLTADVIEVNAPSYRSER